jgi:copper transport protein
MRPTLLVALVAWVGLFIASVGPVRAHANLMKSDPPPNAVLEDVHEVTLWFSEPPELKFSEIVVYDASGHRIDDVHMEADDHDPLVLLVELPELHEGSYTVAWKTLSAVDGHVARGAFVFAIGIGQQPGQPVVPGLAAADAAAPTPRLDEVLIRWWSYLAVAILTGGVVFGWWVAGPALGWGREAQRASRWSMIGAGAVALGLGLCAFAVQAATVADVRLADALGSPARELLGTRYGLFWAVRVATIVVLAGTLLIAWTPRRRRWLAPFQAILAGALLLTFSLNSHAAAVPSDVVLSVTADWLHMIGAAIWVGGLFQLATVAPYLLRQSGVDRKQALGAMVGRFSPWAAWSVAGLMATGLYQALMDLGTLEAVIETPFGLTLIGKLLLVVGMLGLGLVNARWLRPRLMAEGVAPDTPRGARLAGRFRRVVGAEALLGILVLGAAGALTAQETGREAAHRAPRGFRAAQAVEDVQVQVGVTPALAGLNGVEVRLKQGWWGSPAPADRVTLRFEHLLHDMGEIEVVADPAGDGRWAAPASGLAMVGHWRMGVLIRRGGRDDVRADFEVPLADPGETADRGAAGAMLTASRAVAGLSLMAIAVYCLARDRPRSRGFRPLLVRRVVAAGASAAGIALLWIAATQEGPAPPTARGNPISPTEASLERGRAIFATSCAVCHGPLGRGDGPLAASLQPPPANLQQHARDHPETYLYGRIGKGSPGTAMPAFESALSDEERWHLVNYIVQTLGAED